MTETHIEYIIKKMPILETERLVLRKITRTDASDMYEYSSVPEVSEYLTWSPHESLAYTKKYIKYIISQYKNGEYLDWAITLKNSGKMIGTCGFTSVDINNSSVEIGYVLNVNYHNNGYATEAVKELLEHTFTYLDFNRVVARVMEGNNASVKLLDKFGFRHEGTGVDELYVKGKFVNVMHFALCKNEYIKR